MYYCWKEYYIKKVLKKSVTPQFVYTKYIKISIFFKSKTQLNGNFFK